MMKATLKGNTTLYFGAAKKPLSRQSAKLFWKSGARSGIVT